MKASDTGVGRGRLQSAPQDRLVTEPSPLPVSSWAGRTVFHSPGMASSVSHFLAFFSEG